MLSLPELLLESVPSSVPGFVTPELWFESPVLAAGNCPDFAHPIDRTKSKVIVAANILFLRSVWFGVVVICYPHWGIKATRGPCERTPSSAKCLIFLDLLREEIRENPLFCVHCVRC